MMLRVYDATFRTVVNQRQSENNVPTLDRKCLDRLVLLKRSLKYVPEIVGRTG